jgi:ABC-type branched-subunit amino acid transport system ATPase component/MFS family permease
VARNGKRNGQVGDEPGTARELPVVEHDIRGDDLNSARRRREMSLMQRGWADFKSTMREAAQYKEVARSPYGLRPVMMFTLIGAVSAVDASVFGAAFPEIVKALDIDLVQLIGIFSIISFFLIFISLGLAFWADRTRRVPFLGIGAIISGINSLITAGAHSYFVFGAAQAGNAVGGEILDIPGSSLTADYYPVDVRGKTFALRGVIGRVLRIFGPLIVAYLATATSLKWRLPWLITGPLLILSGILTLILLREPVRGYMERKAVGVAEDEAVKPEDPVSFGEAWRTIWGIRTLRRLFISSIPLGMAEYIFGISFVVLLFEKYGLDIKHRAYLYSGIAVVALPFGFMAGGVLDSLLRRRPQRVLVFTGLLSIAAAFFYFFIGFAPPLWVVGVCFSLFGAFGALLGPARNVLFVQILPAHVRTMGGAIFALAAIPGTVFQFFIIQNVFKHWGTQGLIFASVPLYLLSAVIELSAAGLFERDMRSAAASAAAGAAWRTARDEGQAKLLVCRDVDVEYDGVQVLFGVDFDVADGDIVALLGTNGAGKSTLLRAINGTHEASSGAVVFDGRDITHMPPHEVAARGVVSMPGGRGVFPDLTVRDNLMLGNWLNEAEDAETRLEQVFELFPVLKARAGERAQLMSGGEQQMLSLAMAFLNKPRLLLIDELSLGLSPAMVQQLIEIVRAIHAQGTTIIIVEQSVNVALTVAERAIFMEKGEVRFVGRTEDLLRRPDILRAVYVKGTGAVAGAGRSAVKSERERRRYSIESARTILDVSNVSKAFGGVQAVNDVSFTLREGEALGLIGPNGAGKTTVFDLVSGYQIPDAGSIDYEGVDVTSMSADERARLGLIRRFQDARLFPSLSVYENILVSLERRAEVRSIFLTTMQVPQARQAERRLRRRAERLIELLELGAFRDKFVKELSTGLRRITDIACILATEPRLLLLDEPSTGIAQAESENLAPLLRRVRHETGCSLLVIEHDMPLISEVSDELLAMDQGRVVLRGTPDTVLNDERVISSYLGTSENVIERSGLTGSSKRKVTQKR